MPGMLSGMAIGNFRKRWLCCVLVYLDLTVLSGPPSQLCTQQEIKHDRFSRIFAAAEIGMSKKHHLLLDCESERCLTKQGNYGDHHISALIFTAGASWEIV
jgi:hypothetical protein